MLKMNSILLVFTRVLEESFFLTFKDLCQGFVLQVVAFFVWLHVFLSDFVVRRFG